MNILVLILFCLLGIFMLIIIILAYRNNWVYQTNYKYIHDVHKFVMDKLMLEGINLNQQRYYDAVFSYEQMMCRFWAWDIIYLTKEFQVYAEVYRRL